MLTICSNCLYQVVNSVWLPTKQHTSMSFRSLLYLSRTSLQLVMWLCWVRPDLCQGLVCPIPIFKFPIMIHIHGVQSQDKQSEAYIIEFQKTKLLVAQRMPLSTLQYFKSHCVVDKTNSEMKEQSKILQNPTYELVNGQMKFKGRTLFDLSYLNKLDISGVSYILVCDYKDLLVLPYLTRRSTAKVLLTVTMYNMGKQILQRFYKRIQETDRTRQTLQEPDYFQESNAYQLFEEKYGLKMDNWTSIYSEKDMKNMLERCIKLNYGQIFEECGIEITPLSSGSSAASAMWMIKSNLTKQCLLFANNLSIHEWRHCLSAETTKLTDESFNIILGGKCVKTSEETSKDNFKTFVQSVQNLIRTNKSSFVLIEDVLDILDFVDTLSMLFQSSLRYVYIYNPTFKELVKYANSLVEYLNPYLKGKIYRQNPEYPFSNYEALVTKNLFGFGSASKLAEENRIPLKQQLIRHNPAIHFILDSDYKLDPEKWIQFTHKQLIDKRPTQKQLQQWLSLVRPSKVFSFKQFSSSISNERIQFQSRHQISESKLCFYPCHFSKTSKIVKFSLQNNSLTEGNNGHLLIISKNWRQLLKARLVKQQIIAVADPQANRLLTEQSTVELLDYTFYLSSCNLSESTLIHKCIMEISKKLEI